MAWVAVEQNGIEIICSLKPVKAWDWDDGDEWIIPGTHGSMVILPQGTIKKLIGRELTWNDEAVELK